MRILQIIIVITFLLTLISCGGTNNIKNTEFPSVEIENKSFILFPEDSDTFFWPIFHSENKELEKLLNDSLSMKRIMGLSLEEIKKEKEEVDYPTGYVTSGYSVNFNEGFILDIEFYYVSIGAHFYYGGEHYKYDLNPT